MSDEAGNDDWTDRESGPFCQHFGDPFDCDDLCACGHTCAKHLGGSEEPCQADDCACLAFIAAPTSASL